MAQRWQHGSPSSAAQPALASDGAAQPSSRRGGAEQPTFIQLPDATSEQTVRFYNVGRRLSIPPPPPPRRPRRLSIPPPPPPPAKRVVPPPPPPPLRGDVNAACGGADAGVHRFASAPLQAEPGDFHAVGIPGTTRVILVPKTPECSGSPFSPATPKEEFLDTPSSELRDYEERKAWDAMRLAGTPKYTLVAAGMFFAPV